MAKQPWFIVLALAVLLSAVLAIGGCAPEDEPVAPDPDTEEPADTDDNGDGIEIITEWMESGHANIVVFAAEQEECVGCHDGGAFAEGISDPADLEREFLVAIDCRACHTGRGVELVDAGTVDIPTMDGVQAGTGALCMSCHNGRRVPDPAAERRAAPHPAAQADVVTASGGMPIEGIEYVSSESHAEFTNMCFGCHSGSHAFAPNYNSCEAAECHTSAIDVDTEAEADYDGDGSVGSFQEEVEGLLGMLEDAIVDALDGGSFETEAGAIQFLDSAGEAMEVDDEVYAAAYNHVLATYGGSFGVHNPAFVVSMLQDTYTMLTGEDHPGEPLEQE